MERLLRIGFERAGSWVTDGDSINYLLEQHQEKNNLIYVFTVDGDVKYIGKTTKMLFQRLYFYKNPGAGQTTNERVNGNIGSALSQDKSVEIFVLVDNGLLSFGGYHINLAAGIEDSLISGIQPQWNFRGVRQVEVIAEILNDEPQNAQQQNILLQHPAVISLTAFTLQPTYYAKGFFNLATAQEQFIGANNDNIDIHLNNAGTIVGYINRDANRNNAPRIMGGIALANWFHANFNLGDPVTVEIWGANTINILIPNPGA